MREEGRSEYSWPVGKVWVSTEEAYTALGSGKGQDEY